MSRFAFLLALPAVVSAFQSPPVQLTTAEDHQRMPDLLRISSLRRGADVFLAGAGAGPIYNLLGKKDLGTSEFPAIETELMDGDVAFRQHSAGHIPGSNWPVFLNFAKRYFKR